MAQTFHHVWRVLVPLAMPGITTGITMVFVPSISTFIISRMLGGGSNLLPGDLIEMQFLGNSYNYNLGSAMSLVLMVIVLFVHELHHRRHGRNGGDGMRRWKTLANACGWWPCSASCMCPSRCLLPSASTNRKSRNVWAGFSLRWYKNLLGDEMILQALGVSLVVAFASAIIATVLGTLAAIGVNNMSRRGAPWC